MIFIYDLPDEGDEWEDIEDSGEDFPAMEEADEAAAAGDLVDDFLFRRY